jgi:5-oxopent-3-ene-1,2,5-tricarboxylate decarboxylase / 2-hydroxyhepta-2,4-diene-1,7-dioate isomerase
MKQARVTYAGAVHNATEENGRLRLADGRVVGEDAAVWLPPVQPRTIFALGLNYADHAKELAFKAPTEPLVFLKGPGSVCGHRGQKRRPQGVTPLHY